MKGPPSAVKFLSPIKFPSNIPNIVSTPTAKNIITVTTLTKENQNSASP